MSKKELFFRISDEEEESEVLRPSLYGEGERRSEVGRSEKLRFTTISPEMVEEINREAFSKFNKPNKLSKLKQGEQGLFKLRRA